MKQKKLPHYLDEKPLFYLMKKECNQLNARIQKGEKPVATFSRTGEKRIWDLFDRSEEMQELPEFDEKNMPYGFIPKNKAQVQMSMSPHEKPCGFCKVSAKIGIIALYDKREDPQFLAQEAQKKQYKKEVENKKYPLYEEKKPDHLFLKTQMSHYYLDPTKEPVGIYLSKSNKYSYLYDLSDERKKTHYKKDAFVPIGFLTKEMMQQEGLELEENERPVAYLSFGKTKEKHG